MSENKTRLNAVELNEEELVEVAGGLTCENLKDENGKVFCPHCNTYTTQKYMGLGSISNGACPSYFCDQCNNIHYWVRNKYYVGYRPAAYMK